MSTYWLKQEIGAPLFEDIIWSKPETKSTAGSLLVVGGNSFGFAAPATAYTQAIAAGAGSVKVLLPESLHKMVGHFLPDALYAPYNASGSFAATALEPLLTYSSGTDATLLAGDFGRNSETAVVLEKFASKYTGLLSITQDAADYFLKSPKILLQRPKTALFVSFEQLQKYGMHAKYTLPLLFSMDLSRTVEWLHEFTIKFNVVIVTVHAGNYMVAFEGQVVTQPSGQEDKIWRVKKAARGSVFWLQFGTKPLEAIASSLYGDSI